ncbi:unnamed protein product, partial [Effrenium voratum]
VLRRAPAALRPEAAAAHCGWGTRGLCGRAAPTEKAAAHLAEALLDPTRLHHAGPPFSRLHDHARAEVCHDERGPRGAQVAQRTAEGPDAGPSWPCSWPAGWG